MSEWFIQHDEETEIGPLQPSELLDLVRDGTVTKETLCRKDGSAWFHAGDVGGLFKAAHTHVVGYRCPYCEKSVTEPPTLCKHCDKYVDQAIEIVRDHKGKRIDPKRAHDFDVPQEKFSSWANWVGRLKSQREERNNSNAQQNQAERDRNEEADE